MLDYKEVMDELVKDSIDNGTIVGANVLLLQRGKELYNCSQGFADKEARIPMTRDTIFRMFSMTKPVTSVAVLILAERGKLDLLDNVSLYIPEFANAKVWSEDGTLVPLKREIRIMDLLTMTSGVTYPDFDCEPARQMDQLFRDIKTDLENGNPTDTLDYCRKIASVPLCFQPGANWRYGLSADILGGIVEVVSGQKYGKFLSKEIFEPLGMKDTGFIVPKEKRHRFATNYKWNTDSRCLEPFRQNYLGLEGYGQDVTFESGGAGLASTIDDYSRFGRMLLYGGTFNGVRILGRKTVELMATNHLNKDQLVGYNWDSLMGYGYGCLTRVMMNPGQAGSNASIGEFGWDGWTGNYFIVDPSEDMILLYFIQRCEAGTTLEVRKLRMAAYAALD
ncbi:MAG TPA: serine hydrolase domain-containing protein [Lachnospiraceae bacterium]|nr:serine hydrolase domain-containing protein [Lachnospiraceae bacterium]